MSDSEERNDERINNLAKRVEELRIIVNKQQEQINDVRAESQRDISNLQTSLPAIIGEFSAQGSNGKSNLGQAFAIISILLVVIGAVTTQMNQQLASEGRRMTEIKESTDKALDWQMAHESEVRDTNGRQWERIEATEKSIDTFGIRLNSYENELNNVSFTIGSTKEKMSNLERAVYEIEWVPRKMIGE